MMLWNWIRELTTWTGQSLITLIGLMIALLAKLAQYTPAKTRLNIREFDECRPTVLGVLFYTAGLIVGLGFIGAHYSIWFSGLVAGLSLLIITHVVFEQFEAIEVAFANAQPAERYCYLGRVLWVKVYREYTLVQVALYGPLEKNEMPITVKMHVKS